MSSAHQRIYPITAFPTFRRGTMRVRYHRSVGGCGIAPDLGNDGADVLINIGNGFMSASR